MDFKIGGRLGFGWYSFWAVSKAGQDVQPLKPGRDPRLLKSLCPQSTGLLGPDLAHVWLVRCV